MNVYGVVFSRSESARNASTFPEGLELTLRKKRIARLGEIVDDDPRLFVVRSPVDELISGEHPVHSRRPLPSHSR